MPLRRSLHVVLSSLLLLLLGCENEISQEQAIQATQDFVNSGVKFYARENESATNLERVSLQILQAYKQQGYWYVEIEARSNATGTEKKSRMVVAVDAKTGAVEPSKLRTLT